MRLLLALVLIPCLFAGLFSIVVNADETENAERLENIDRDSGYFDKAQESVENGSYKTARRYFKKVVRNEDEAYLTPLEYAQARVNLAKVYQYLSEKNDALELFSDKVYIEKLTEIDVEKNALLLNGYANTLKYFGELETAEKIADALISKVSNKEIYLETAGEIAYLLGKNEKALKIFDQVGDVVFKHKALLEKYDKTTGDRNISNIYIAACKSLYLKEFIDRENHLKEAFDFARKAVKADKRNIEAYYWAAKITLETETHLDARNLYLDVARQFNDQHPGITHLLIQTYIFEDEIIKATTEADALMHYLPNAEESLLAKIEMCNLEQNFAKAKTYIEKLLEINPKHLYGLSLKALNCLQLGNQESFNEIEKQVLALNKTYSDFYTPIVRGLVKNYQFEEAIKLGEKGLKLEAKNWALHKQLGFAYAWQGLDEKRAYELLKLANFNDTLRNKLYTLNISQTLLVLQEEFKTQTSLDKNFIIKIHESAAELMFPYFEDALMSDFKDLSKKYGFKPVTPIIVEGFHRLDDFGSRTTGLPATSTFGASFGRLITLALPQASAQQPFGWRRVIRRELEKTFLIQMSKGFAPASFLEGYTQYSLRQFRSTWRMQNQYDLIKSYFDETLDKLSKLNTATLNLSTRNSAVYQGCLIMQMLEEQQNSNEVFKQLIEMFAQKKTFEEAIMKVTGLLSGAFDVEFRKFVKKSLIDKIKIVERPGMVQLQKLIIKYENDQNVKPLLAWAYFCNNMNAEAYKLAEEVYKQNEKDKFALYIIGMQKIQNAGENTIMRSEAMDFLLKAEKNGFEDYGLYIQIARIYEQDSPSEALKYYKKAIDSFPEFIGGGSAYMNLLQILVANEDNFQMYQYAEQMCKYTELQPGLRLMLAKYYLSLGNSPATAKWLRDIVEMIPHMNDIPNNINEIHRKYANACESSKLWHAAAVEWRICLTFEKLDKMKADLYLKSANAYKNAGAFDIALKMVAKSIELNDTKEARDLKLSIELAKSKSKP